MRRAEVDALQREQTDSRPRRDAQSMEHRALRATDDDGAVGRAVGDAADASTRAAPPDGRPA